MLDSSLLTILIGFLSGYLLLSRSWRFSFRYLRLSGYRSLFEAILWSLPFLAAGRFACASITDQWPAVYAFWHSVFPVRWLGTTLAAVALSWITIRILNSSTLGSGRDEHFVRSVFELGSELESFLLTCAYEGKLVMVTLENRKVYIGRVLFPTVEDREIDHIELLPFSSGHRGASDLRLTIDTNYSSTYATLFDEMPEDLLLERLKDIRVVLPVSRMISASLFDQGFFDAMDAGAPPSVELESQAPNPEPATATGRQALDRRHRFSLSGLLLFCLGWLEQRIRDHIESKARE